MSKIGQKIIVVPASVNLGIDSKVLVIKGAGGSIEITIPEVLSAEKTSEGILMKRKNNEKKTKSLHGLFRQLIANAVQGVERAWEKKLEIVGTGFNVKMQGEDLVFKLGYSHPVTFKKQTGVNYKVEGNNKAIVSGADRQLVGQVAYQIKMLKKPDAYKGKGIKYEGEQLRIKPGKKAKTAGAPA